MDKKSKVHFPNLNAVRFIAALGVLIHHLEQYKLYLGFPSQYETSPFINVIGKLGVVLFFVLSGYLITFLLLVEEASAGIQIYDFYVRRMLRIWPLYFLIVIFGLLVAPHVPWLLLPSYPLSVVQADLATKAFLYLALFPNLVLSGYGFLPYLSQTWSIGTEEQFYLVWPLLMKHIRNKWMLMVSVIVVYLVVRVLISNHLGLIGQGVWQSWLIGFHGTFNIDCMAIGGLAAVLLHRQSRLLPWLLNRRVFYGTVLITTLLILKGVTVPHLHFEVYAGLFSLIILNLSANKQLGFSLEFEPFVYLGKISYGIYMFHPIAIVVSLRLLNKVFWTNDFSVYLCSIAITIFISSVSYKFFESYFLNKKIKYVHV